MFKKVLLLFLIISPLSFLWLGYPVVDNVQELPRFAASQRCFIVGEFSQYLDCLIKHHRIGGVNYLTMMFESLSKIQLGFDVLLLSFLWITFILIFLIINYLNNE